MSVDVPDHIALKRAMDHVLIDLIAVIRQLDVTNVRACQVQSPVVVSRYDDLAAKAPDVLKVLHYGRVDRFGPQLVDTFQESRSVFPALNTLPH